MVALPFSPPSVDSWAVRVSVTIAIWLAVALLGSGAMVTYESLRGIRSSNTLTDQVNAVQRASEQLLSSLTDAETGQRGYLLTNDPSYLGPYDAARTRLDADFTRLEAAPLSTPQRVAQILRVRELAAAKLAELGRTIKLHDSGQEDAALRLVRTNQGKHTMDAIRTEVSSFQIGAAAKLDQARAAVSSAWTWVEVVMLSGMAVAILAGVVWAKRKIEHDIRAKFYQLERFRRAFGLSKGTLRGLDGRILFWNSGAQRLYGYTPDEAIGKVCRELLQSRFPQPFEEIESVLLKTGEWQGQLTCRHRDGSELHVISNWALSRGEAGEPDVVIELSTNITAIRIAERKREEADALLRAIVDTAPGLIYAKDRQGRMILANAATLKLLGKPWAEVEGCTDLELLEDQAQAGQVAANDRRVMEHGVVEEVEEEVRSTGSQARVWSSTKAPLRDGTRTVIGLVGVSVEITERKRTEDRLHLMVNELNHRVKNTLATVQAIATQTLRGSDPVLRQKLEARLVALAAAHDVLTRERWEGANLDDVVAEAVAPFGGPESGRLKVSGPPLRLTPRAALALAMGLHELTTNAFKYGALSAASGRVEIGWEVTPDAIPLFRLTWSEKGGPAITAPSRLGFGIRLIERSLAQDLGGTAAVSFDDPEGIVGLVEAPLADVAASAEVLPLLRVGPGVR